MRTAAHLASIAALAALGLALGRWLREPNAGGLVFLLLLAVGAAIAIRWLYRPRPEPPPPRSPAALRPPEPPLWAADDPRVDLNAAGLEELQRLPGVGPVAARRILEERVANGPFASVEDLVRVPGFGPAKVRVLAPEARV